MLVSRMYFSSASKYLRFSANLIKILFYWFHISISMPFLLRCVCEGVSPNKLLISSTNSTCITSQMIQQTIQIVSSFSFVHSTTQQHLFTVCLNLLHCLLEQQIGHLMAPPQPHEESTALKGLTRLPYPCSFYSCLE